MRNSPLSDPSLHRLSGLSPFDENAPEELLVRAIVHDPIFLPTHDHIGPNEVVFIRALLERAPASRLGSRGIDEVLTHFFLAGEAHVMGG